MAVAPRERRATRDRSDRATAVRIGARSRGHAVTSFIAFRLLQRHSAGECQSLTCPRSWAGRPLRSSTSYTASWLEWDGSSPNREPKRRSAAFATCPFFYSTCSRAPIGGQAGHRRAEPSDHVCTGHRRADSDASEPRLRYGIKSGRSPIESMTKSGGRRARSSASFRNLPVFTRTPVTPLS
jgi:hypothetical protein